MTAFLKVDARHDGQVNRLAEVYQVRIRLVLNFQLLRLCRLLVVLIRLVIVVVAILLPAPIPLLAPALLSQNLRLGPPVQLLVLLVLRIELEHVQSVHRVNLVVQVHLVRNLVLLLDQIQLVPDRRVVLEPVPAHLEQHLDHVLHPLVDARLVQDGPKLLVDGVVDARANVLEQLAHLAREPHGNLDAVVRGVAEQQHEYLDGDDFVRNELVAQVRDERGARQTHRLVVPLERLAELHHQPVDQQLAHLRELRVDHGRHCRVDWRKRQGRRLRLHDAPAVQPASAYQVLVEQLGDNVLDV